MKSCDGGSVPVNTSGVRGSKHSCCRVCEGGTYRPYLSPLLQCLPCPPGYFCPPGKTNHPLTVCAVSLFNNRCVYRSGTEHYNSYWCPPGHVCPLGSSQPLPCPPGSFGNLTHAGTRGDCHPCPAGTFNHLPAQDACFPCGSSSTSAAGQITLHKKNIQSSKSAFFSAKRTTPPHPLLRHSSSQALRLVPVLAKIERSSTRTARACAGPVSFSTTSWISKARHQTACPTASLRSVDL